MNRIPVIAIDGPSGSGKGTVSRAVARELGWHFLDSGAIYRSLAVAVLKNGVNLDDVPAIVAIAEAMDLAFTADEPPAVVLNGANITADIATEVCGNTASKIASIGPVRAALLQKQKDFRKAPGLVADGRDMGSVVFKDADVKIYLTASARVRAERRHKQLSDKGTHVNLDSLTREIEERDQRDRERKEAPLVVADGARVIDSSELAPRVVIDQVLDLVKASMT